jgi:hypothetical protein
MRNWAIWLTPRLASGGVLQHGVGRSASESIIPQEDKGPEDDGDGDLDREFHSQFPTVSYLSI